MASRQDEKEKRRQERLAKEEAARKAAARKRVTGLIGGALLALLAVGAILLVVTGGGDDDPGAADASTLRKAAAAAGCEFRQLDTEGRDHVDEPRKASDFKSNPPTSGTHNPVAAQDGFYQPGNEPDIGNWVHALEHGRVLFQYKPGASPQQVQQLRDIANEELQGSPGYHTLVMQNNTDMPKRFAAVAWTRYLACDDLSEETLDVMRTFRRTYTDQAPELIP